VAVRILLADDHTIVRQGFKSILEREGFQVVAEASDGRDVGSRSIVPTWRFSTSRCLI
jgi:DNA-binding NarL/FixJ family response regulator